MLPFLHPRNYSTSRKETFYPTHCNIPKETPLNKSTQAAVELTYALQQVATKQPRKLSCLMEALEKLNNIFTITIKEGQKEVEQRVSGAPHFQQLKQRVQESETPSSSNPTQQ